MTNPSDPRKTDKPHGERTVPDVPQPVPPDEAEDNEDLIVTQDSGPFEGEAQAEPPPSSSAVNLGPSGEVVQPGQTASGEIPSDPWTDLLRESHESGPGEPARFDDPEDADMLRHALEQEAAGAQADTGESAVGIPPAPTPDSSSVELGVKASPGPSITEGSSIIVAEAVAEPGAEPAESPAEVFIYDSDVKLAEDVPEAEAEPSAVDLAAQVVPSVEDSSSVDLGGAGPSEALVVDSSSGSDLQGAVLPHEEEPIPASAVDLGNAAEEALLIGSSAVLASPVPEGVPEALPQESSQSDVIIGADAGPAGETPPSSISGLDLGQSAAPVIQVDSDSGMNLGAGAEEFDEDEVGTFSLSADEAFVEAPEGTSSVNLGMPMEERGSDRDLIAEAVESGVDLEHGPQERPETGSYADVVVSEHPAAGPGDSAVDLGAPAVADDEVAELLRQESEAAPDTDLTRAWQPGEPKAARKTSIAGEDELLPHPTEDQDSSAEGVEEAGAAGSGRSDEDSILSTLVDQQSGGVAAEEEETRAAAGAPGVVDEEDEVETFTAEAGEGVAEEPAAEKEEAEEEEEERRVPPAKPKYGRSWAGGILVGAVLGGVACVALWMFGIEPPKAWRGETTTEPPKGGAGQRPVGPAEVRQSLDDLLVSGDFSKEPPAINEADAADRTKRGRYRLLQYLSRTDLKNAKVKDPAVQEALTDLSEAAKQNNADAYLWQGFAYEETNELKKAQQVYQEGADKFKGDPAQKARFDSALDRLQVQTPAKAAGALLRPPARFDAAQLALLLLLLEAPGQAPPQGQPPQGQQPDRPQLEAGVSFWRAARLARDRKYDEALTALAEARKVHDANRRSRLYKPQNPTSDPLENIFLRACDELKVYWELQKKLGDGGYLAADKSPADAVDAVFTALKKAKKSADELKSERDDLAKKKKDAEDKLAPLETDLGKEKKARTDAEATVKDKEKKLEKATRDLDEQKTKLGKALVQVEGLEKEKADLEKEIGQIGNALKPLGVDPKSGREAMLRKLQDVVKVMKENKGGDQMLQTVAEIRRLTETLGQRWAPETMVSYWLPILADRAQKDLAVAAVKDVERVRADDRSGAAAKAQALAVEGLAQRNRGDFAKARQTLKEAEEAAGTAAWKDLVTKARKELEDPAAFYLPQAERLRGQGRYAEALAVLDEGLKAFPDRSGRLLAVRSLVRLDAAAAKVRGKLREDSPGLKEARADAVAAIRAGSQGAGHFAAGRLAEALGQRDAAVASYRRAVNEAPAGSAELSLYSLALARMLQQQAEGRGALLPGPRGGPAVVGRPLSVREMLLMTMVGLQPPSPEELSQKEALDLADKILQRKDIDEQPLLKAQALAIKGQWTEALNTYVEGLRPHLGRDQFEGLKYIVTNHPVQRTPDRLRVPQPFQAERHYLAGLSRYHSRDFANAEKEFALAISNFDQDARYHYFLALSRLQQGKRGSAEDFDEAARLEADGRPARDAVDTALERIQGEPRRLIRDARNRIR